MQGQFIPCSVASNSNGFKDLFEARPVAHDSLGRVHGPPKDHDYCWLWGELHEIRLNYSSS